VAIIEAVLEASAGVQQGFCHKSTHLTLTSQDVGSELGDITEGDWSHEVRLADGNW
jgi:hypothetical protein